MSSIESVPSTLFGLLKTASAWIVILRILTFLTSILEIRSNSGFLDKEQLASIRNIVDKNRNFFIDY
ncbi:hypothetical protein GCM10009430_18210 [Aquimarina litoralis]|uniref:Uncharacterized protein n=1 Tax=Aquimarina litoralis TaxID=584605 RepID=A0ABP3TWV7_9FLAO